VTLKEPKVTKAGEFLELACTATDANPKTTIVWFRGPTNHQIPIMAEGNQPTNHSISIGCDAIKIK
jgi:hypothetical protein